MPPLRQSFAQSVVHNDDCLVRIGHDDLPVAHHCVPGDQGWIEDTAAARAQHRGIGAARFDLIPMCVDW